MRQKILLWIMTKTMQEAFFYVKNQANQQNSNRKKKLSESYRKAAAFYYFACMLKISVDDNFKYFFLVFLQNRIWHCMQIVSFAWKNTCKILFTRKNKKNITSLSFSESAHGMVSVNK